MPCCVRKKTLRRAEPARAAKQAPWDLWGARVAASARGCALAHEDRSRRQRPVALSAPSADRARALNSEVPRCAGRDPGAIRVRGAIQGHAQAGCTMRARVLRRAGETGVVRPSACPARPQGHSRPFENRGVRGAVCANTVRTLRLSVVRPSACPARPQGTSCLLRTEACGLQCAQTPSELSAARGSSCMPIVCHVLGR